MISVGKKSVSIKQGNITAESTDAIVNPANSKLQHGGGAARAIAVKGGPEIQKQSNDIIKRIGSVPVGKAVITDAGNLLCKFVIHTVGPQWGEGNEQEKLRKAMISVLTLAELYNLKSVSIPAISSGIFGFPKTDCAKILLETAYWFLQQDGVGLEHIVMCNFDDETYQIFLREEKRLSEELGL
ncbi:macro domain-containing protein [Propionispora hippei]|uniref:O-acetyl-ADP-ribose deacetylase (Regulator of RNase III), contains Macro domain n=1 Tax=Propionispora hippei DSM 15287 TaxID=1123003 RepID=A0A1M6DWW3_9FIRM|nr:macro domain-containing protein [Propionispora hippei]SHI77665.1 O-acetyl-ADP-ribose deacetylase (regulator of RNase III), contains Macro domain [Propionispora hippei DSM 15287]